MNEIFQFVRRSRYTYRLSSVSNSIDGIIFYMTKSTKNYLFVFFLDGFLFVVVIISPHNVKYDSKLLRFF